MTPDQQHKLDMQFLLERAEFRRFLFRVIQTSGIFTRTTDGSVGRDLAYDEGRRNLGLDILDMAETGQPIPEVHPAGPLLTLIQALREETSQPTEKPSGRRNPDRYDRNAELDDAGDGDGE
jgi:hypothetical protein